MEIKGGCLCGAVRYTADADPTAATICHCHDCQQFTGAVFATLVAVSRDALTITGTMKTFSSIGGSGKPILRHSVQSAAPPWPRNREHGRAW
jgi:hypothetical protein